MDRDKAYELAERGAVGWHASAADGASSTSGYGRDIERVLPDLADGAIIIDKAGIADRVSFAGDVMRAPMHGDPSRNGAFVEALREAPYMMAVVENYGLAGATAVQVAVEASDEPTYGPLDYAPAEYLADYWHARGARIGRLIHTVAGEPGVIGWHKCTTDACERWRA
jgi:hypothetical protein